MFHGGEVIVTNDVFENDIEPVEGCDPVLEVGPWPGPTGSYDGEEESRKFILLDGSKLNY